MEISEFKEQLEAFLASEGDALFASVRKKVLDRYNPRADSVSAEVLKKIHESFEGLIRHNFLEQEFAWREKTSSDANTKQLWKDEFEKTSEEHRKMSQHFLALCGAHYKLGKYSSLNDFGASFVEYTEKWTEWKIAAWLGPNPEPLPEERFNISMLPFIEALQEKNYEPPRRFDLPEELYDLDSAYFERLRRLPYTYKQGFIDKELSKIEAEAMKRFLTGFCAKHPEWKKDLETLLGEHFNHAKLEWDDLLPDRQEKKLSGEEWKKGPQEEQEIEDPHAELKQRIHDFVSERFWEFSKPLYDAIKNDPNVGYLFEVSDMRQEFVELQQPLLEATILHGEVDQNSDIKKHADAAIYALLDLYTKDYEMNYDVLVKLVIDCTKSCIEEWLSYKVEQSINDVRLDIYLFLQRHGDHYSESLLKNINDATNAGPDAELRCKPRFSTPEELKKALYAVNKIYLEHVEIARITNASGNVFFESDIKENEAVTSFVRDCRPENHLYLDFNGLVQIHLATLLDRWENWRKLQQYGKDEVDAVLEQLPQLEGADKHRLHGQVERAFIETYLLEARKAPKGGLVETKRDAAVEEIATHCARLAGKDTPMHYLKILHEKLRDMNKDWDGKTI